MSDADEPDGGGWVPAAAEAAAESLAQLAAFAVGGPLGIPFGVVASRGAIALTRKAAEELSERRWHSAARAVEEAAEVNEQSPQALLEGMMQKPDTAQLLADALHAAANTFDQRKVTALARALANGASSDGTRVDSERLMIRALADLEPAHIRLLGLLNQRSGQRGQTARSLMNTYTLGAEGRMVPALNADVFELMPVLLRHGLAEEDADARWETQVEAMTQFIDAQNRRFGPGAGPAVEPGFIITEFGRRSLRYLDAGRAVVGGHSPRDGD